MFDRSSTSRSIPGVLFIEDFDATEIVSAPADQAAPPKAVAGLTEPIEIETIKEEAFRAGFEAGQKSAQECFSARRADLLSRFGEELSRAQTEIREVCEGGLAAITEAVFELLVQLLPTFLQTHGETEVRAALRSLLPALSDETRLEVSIHPSLEGAVREEVGRLKISVPTAFVADSNLVIGDIRISWQSGMISRDLDAVCRKAIDCLTRVGLLSGKEVAS